MSDKKKVYVETIVISDATALPTRDLVQAGRQLVTREWWNTAAERFDLFSSNVVANEARWWRESAARTAIRVRASTHRKCYRKEAAYDYRETIRFHS